MAKTFDFEVATRVSVVDPEGFAASVGTIGAEIFDKPRQSGYYIDGLRGIGVKPKDQHFRTVKAGRLRYIHFDRAVEPFGEIGFKFLQLLLQVSPTMRSEGVIGGIDLECEIARTLQRSIGERSIAGQIFEFNEIDDAPSERDPESRLFVLRQTKQKSEVPDLETEFTDDLVFTEVKPLAIISSFISSYVSENHPDIFNLGGDSVHAVEDGLIVGSTDDFNPGKIEAFKAKFSKQFFKDGPILVRAGNTSVDTKL